MKRAKSLIDRLHDELNNIEAACLKVLEASQISRELIQDNPFASIDSAYGDRKPLEKRSRYKWLPLSAEYEAEQTSLKSRFASWRKESGSILQRSGTTQQRELDTALNHVANVIDYRRFAAMPKSIPEALLTTKSIFGNVRKTLVVTLGNPPYSLILVPDTNTLIDNPDITTYAAALDEDTCIVIVPSAVISELDELKIKLRNDRERAKRVQDVIRNLENWGQLSDSTEPVQLNSKTQFQMLAIEPDLSIAPYRLDAANNDDRVVAAVIEIQREHPTVPVVLLTSDLNLRNKAKLAHISHTSIRQQADNT